MCSYEHAHRLPFPLLLLLLLLKIIAYSRDLNDTFSQQLPRFIYLPRSEGGMHIYATSTSFCSLSLINPTVYGKSIQNVEYS